VTFRVTGQPLPKQRARVFEDARGKRRAVTPDRTKDWEQWIGWYAVYEMHQRGLAPLTGDVRMTCEFERHGRQRADLDNLIKAVSDALNGIVWQDDTQVVGIVARVVYGVAEPGVSVRVESV
jgi:Holliday junction resolvase RusA-like endonuclease